MASWWLEKVVHLSRSCWGEVSDALDSAVRPVRAMMEMRNFVVGNGDVDVRE
jgi:hypothetical protein